MVREMLDWIRALDDLLFPKAPSCPLCGTRPSLPIGSCRKCFESLAVLWQISTIHGLPYGSLFAYQGFARDVIHRMKYQSGYDAAAALGTMLGLALREEPSFSDVDVIIPVPLHSERLQQRGFNQSAVLADNITRQWKRPIFTGIIRIKNTPSQSGLHSLARRENVRGAFAILPGYNLQGKKCLIIDDVITSGWTFQSMAQLIKGYGGMPVGAFLARAERDYS